MKVALSDIAKAVQKAKRVVIIGYPASGKTTLANMLKAHCQHRVFHSDGDYSYGPGMSDLALLEVEAEAGPVIFEGVLGYRLLRKCVTAEGCTWRPDLIIEVCCSEATRAHRYAIERPDKKYSSIAPFCKGLDSCLRAWNESFASKNVKRLIYNAD